MGFNVRWHIGWQIPWVSPNSETLKSVTLNLQLGSSITKPVRKQLGIKYTSDTEVSKAGEGFVNKQCASEMTSWRYLKNGLGLGRGRPEERTAHTEARICFGDNDYYSPSWVKSSYGEVRLNNNIRKIGLVRGLWGLFFHPNNEQSLECFFSKYHMNSILKTFKRGQEL